MPSVEELIAATNPHTTKPDPSEIDAALGRVLARRAELASTDTSVDDTSVIPHNRRRRLVPAAVASAAAVAAAVVISTSGGGGPSGQHPGTGVTPLTAALTVARVANVINGPATGILHVVTEDSSGLVGGPQITDQDESWIQMDGQHAYWDRFTWETGSSANGSTTETVVAGDSMEQYSSQTDTITQVPTTPATSPSPFGDLALGMTGTLANPGVKGSQADPSQPGNFSAQVTALLYNPQVTVNQNADFEGQPAISLYSAAAQDTLYVQSGTYQPLAVVMISPANGHNGPIGQSYQQVISFKTWQVIPDGSVSVPDLAQLYPTAPVRAATSLKN